MKHLICVTLGLALPLVPGTAQSTFQVTGARLPVSLAKQNYGKLPKGVSAYDLSICNARARKESLSSGEVYQALSEADPSLHPVGRQVVLSSILETQNWSAARIVGLALTVAVDALSIVLASKTGGKIAAAALGSLSVEQIATGVNPAPSPNQIETLETQALEPALVLDGGSCVERTVFAASADSKAAKAESLSFHVR
ncbi:MAG: hypothetical protein JOY62_09820 [Acidobacteriaceae bacterium]|nr:hypothetical protein [Acidobacteriaceae bacterium]MBV9780256.1 hypothetical protein [Acidobacteriaceae bacterium]